ncbi:MAG: HigA family addiction module antitoxin [Proteobacteria bacterium]|nr:HigA family addiction module antitoxin [Pseudomonadota bacterium]
MLKSKITTKSQNIAVSDPKVSPPHPGEILLGYYLEELGWTQADLAKDIGCSYVKINEIVNGKRGISASFAIDLEQSLGTRPQMWLSLQATYDIWHARKKRKRVA